MAASSNPPSGPPPTRASLRAPYASLAPKANEPSASVPPPASSQHQSHVSVKRTQPTWTDTTKARARTCKTHGLVRRPDGTCMVCEREERAARGKSSWLWLLAALAVGGGVAAWLVLPQTPSSSAPLPSSPGSAPVKVSPSVPAKPAPQPAAAEPTQAPAKEPPPREISPRG